MTKSENLLGLFTIPGIIFIKCVGSEICKANYLHWEYEPHRTLIVCVYFSVMVVFGAISALIVGVVSND